LKAVATTAHCAIEGYKSAIETFPAETLGEGLRRREDKSRCRSHNLEVTVLQSADVDARTGINPQPTSTASIRKQIMDSGLVPSEIVVKHFVSHKFILEIGPSITCLGRPIRNLLIGAAVIYCAQQALSALQGGLKSRNTK
jgi:hypothetical protein